MIKRTLYFGNPAYLSLRLNQLVVKIPNPLDESNVKTIPIEDIAMVVLDNRQITITQALIAELVAAGASVVTCDAQHHPTGMMLPLCVNTLQSERWSMQVEASLPMKKQIWQQTIQMKILNQAAVLEYTTNEKHPCMLKWANEVKSGDPENMEARAAAYYWKNVFRNFIDSFVRDREEAPPNNLLNYGYALLRATIARSLVCSGLLPTLGVHHHNRYNAYCLADDIMEPYRPYVDKLVYDLIKECSNNCQLDSNTKLKLLSIPSIDVTINQKSSPLMVAATTTTASLVRFYSKESKQIIYPNMHDEQ